MTQEILDLLISYLDARDRFNRINERDLTARKSAHSEMEAAESELRKATEEYEARKAFQL